VFFDEIKRNLLIGNIIGLTRFGKFYIGAGNSDINQNVKDKIEIKRSVIPKFKTAASLKKLIASTFG
jgi:nucleoid DNA-binding protein